VYLVPFLATVMAAALVTRFLRRSHLIAAAREALSARSPWFAKLFSCPHCLCFWTSVLCAAVLAQSWLQAGALVLLGWRGGYYTNRLIDALIGTLAGSTAPGPATPDACHVCGLKGTPDFLQRQAYAFCSHRCWFDYLKTLSQESRIAAAPVFAADGTPARQDVYPSAPAELSVEAARQLMEGTEPCTYVDVRTPEEFDDGHPRGAINIPLYLRTADELVPNGDFVRAVSARFARDAALLIGDGIGSHSAPAARLLAAGGFTRVSRVQDGYHNTRNLAGQTQSRGWSQQGFPVEHEATEEQRYQPLYAPGKTRN
jgi:rhodanese-related sulfurtransferase